jgi:hypothetical protein
VSGRYLTPRVQVMPDGVRRVRLMLDTADLPLVRSSSTSVTGMEEISTREWLEGLLQELDESRRRSTE